MPRQRQLLKRQQVLADFGEFAMRSDDLDEVLTEACRLVAEALGTGRAKVLEIQEGRQELLVRAGVGWEPGVVGSERLQMSDRSSETYAINLAEPVISQDIAMESRFEIPEFMKKAGVVALVNVPIFVPGRRPYGVLQVDATTPREFGDDEVLFLRTYAMILGPVIDRLHLIDERTKMQGHLKSSETRHRLLIESWAQAAWEVDAEGVVVADSPSWRAYTGQTLADWLGGGWLNAVHPDDRADAEDHWREAITARGLVNAEFRLRAPDGGWRWTNVRAAPVLDAERGVEKWVGMNIDIDARKQAEAAVLESQQRHAFMLKLSDALRSLVDPLTIQKVAARVLGEHLGASRVAYVEVIEDEYVVRWDYTDGIPSMVGPHPVGSFGPGKIADYQEGRSRVVCDTWVDVHNAPSDTANLAAHHVRAGVGVPLIKDGKFIATLVVHMNVPRNWSQAEVALIEETAERTWQAVERSRAEEARAEIEARLEAVFEALPVGVHVADLRGRTILANRELKRFLPRGIIPSQDPDRVGRWRAWDADGAPILPQNFPGARSLRGEAVVPGIEMLYTDDDGREIWTAVSSTPVRNDQGEVIGQVGVVTDIDLLKRSMDALRASEERLRTATEVGRIGLWDWHVRSGQVHWSDEHFRLEGYQVGEVAPSYEAWVERVHPEDRAETEEALRAARDDGSDYVHEFRTVHPDGAVRWLSAYGRFFHDHRGRPYRMVGAMIDVTERREWADRQNVLLAELQHRVRNILAVTRSIVSRSNDGERSTEDYVQHLQGRLSALARTQALLTRRTGAGVDLEEIIRDELLAQTVNDGQFLLSGPDVELSPKAAEVLTLAVHELATNATKYGAFSRTDGRLIVHWQVEARDGQRWLVLFWSERGVPIIDSIPRRLGFGSELISRRIPYELRGFGTFVLKPGGLESHIEFPLRSGDSILQTNGVA
jgi:PAS domain S-box-containing protein